MDYEKMYKAVLGTATQWIKDGCSDKEKICLESIFPELRESEDERIRRTLVEYFGPGAQLDFIRGVPIQKIRDWLEKQKEQKPAQTVDEKEYVRTLKGLISDFIYYCGNDITNVEHYQNIYDWLDGRHIEQEPVEYLSKDKVYAIMNKLTELSTSELIPLNSDEYKKINEITSDIRSLLDYPIEQKPAEWSEEDEKMLLSIIRDFAQGHKSSIGQDKWLKSLRPSWEPSENQMSMLLAVINDPNNAGSESCHLSLKSLYNDLKKL